ncbi:MAG TPA: fasciclin domain-containing protein [Bacteroidales bacterium]|nr:fasciclin domain-containing protein [Bacteroidales bacterium]
MKIMINRLIVAFVILGGVLLNSCKKVDYVQATSNDVLIGTYFKDNPDNFSEFYDLLQKSGNLSFLDAYGTYTCFAPTNDAIDAFLKKKGKTLDDFTQKELTDLVRYHIIIDTLNTTQFTDGKLPKPTMYGQYLTARTYFENGEAKIKINKYSTIVHRDIHAANGIIHAISTVLDPVTKPIATMIDEDPQFSIFSAALKATTLADTLKLMPSMEAIPTDPDQPVVDNRRWFTVLAVTDEAYHKDGINSFEDLKTRYSDTGDPSNPEDSLYLYTAYHCLDNSLKYVTDMVMERSLVTMAPLEVITIKLKGDSVLVNEEVFNGKLERGAPVDRLNSDITAGNGVYHVMTKNFGIKVRNPMPVYWDVANQPELRKMVGIFRKPGQYLDVQYGQLAGVNWGTNSTIGYAVDAGWMGQYYVYSDYLDINLRQQGIPWIEFTSPLIVKGKYKLWVCTRNVSQARRPIFMVYFDGEQLPNLCDNNVTIPEDLSDDDLELTGYKRYNFNPNDSTVVAAAGEPFWTDLHGRFVGRLAGTIDVPTTGKHTIKFVTINDGRDHVWLDMIHIIPYDDPQTWPRVDKNGILVDRPESN